MADFSDTHQTLSETLQRAISDIDGDTITLRRLMGIIGEQGLLIVCALLTIPFLLPVSIPGVSTVFGLAIILIAVGITTNRLPWLPRRIQDRPLDTAKLVPILEKGLSVVRRIDRFIKPRLHALTDVGTVNRINGMAIIASGVLLCLPLGLVPFSNTLPALAILFLSAGISQRDGLFVLFGYLMLVATIVYFAVLAYLAVVAGQGISGFFMS